VPLTPDGLKVCKVLSDAGNDGERDASASPPSQAILLAAKAGGDVQFRPFVGRLDDIS